MIYNEPNKAIKNCLVDGLIQGFLLIGNDKKNPEPGYHASPYDGMAP